MAGSGSPSPLCLFTYGTLMLPEIMHAVCGESFPAEPAILAGYGRYLVKNEVFPAITEEKTASTHGLLYRGMDRKALEDLDAFEGDLYCRKEVQVALTDGRTACCLSYLIKDRYRHLLSDSPWDLESFRARHLSAYLASLGVNTRSTG